MTTATPAPNDHMELGQQAEFLSVMAGNEMLSRFFINDTATASQQWRLKKHAERDFWEWMASWSRMAQSPEDLGFDGSRYVLPALEVIRHRAAFGELKPAEGSLFAFEASATAIHDIKRQTADNRADKVAELVAGEAAPWVVWCDTDYEADALADRIPDAVEVRALLRVLPDWELPGVPLFAVHPYRHHVPTKVRAAIDFFSDALAFMRP